MHSQQSKLSSGRTKNYPHIKNFKRPRTHNNDSSRSYTDCKGQTKVQKACRMRNVPQRISTRGPKQWQAAWVESAAPTYLPFSWLAIHSVAKLYCKTCVFNLELINKDKEETCCFDLRMEPIF